MDVAPLKTMFRRLLFYLSFALLSSPAFAHFCKFYLEEPPPLPVWVEKPIEFSQATDKAIMSGKEVKARLCTWCPEFKDKRAVEHWLLGEPFGMLNHRFIDDLFRLSQKNMADHFYGIALRENRLYLISKMPAGRSLQDLLQSDEESPVRFSPQVVKSFARFATFIQDREELNLAYDVSQMSAGGAPQVRSLLDFLNWIEWTVDEAEGLKVSFFHVDRLYNSNGRIKNPFRHAFHRHQDLDLSYFGLMTTLLVKLSQDINDAVSVSVRSLNYGILHVIDFKNLKTYVTQDPLVQMIERRDEEWAQKGLSELFDSFHQLVLEPGPRTWSVVDAQKLHFANEDQWQDHFLKHGQEFSARTQEEYLDYAKAFLANRAPKNSPETDPKHRLIFKRPNTQPVEIVMVEPYTGEIAIFSEHMVLKTFFRNDRKKSGMNDYQFLMEQLRQRL